MAGIQRSARNGKFWTAFVPWAKRACRDMETLGWLSGVSPDLRDTPDLLIFSASRVSTVETRSCRRSRCQSTARPFGGSIPFLRRLLASCISGHLGTAPAVEAKEIPGTLKLEARAQSWKRASCPPSATVSTEPKRCAYERALPIFRDRDARAKFPGPGVGGHRGDRAASPRAHD